eukprot:478466_1
MLLFLGTILVAIAADENQDESSSCEADTNPADPQDNTTQIKRKSLSETNSLIGGEDISPGQYRHVEAPPDVQFWVSFVNERNEEVELFWDDGTPQGRHQSKISPLGASEVGTYRSHKFFARLPGQDEKLATFEMDPEVTQYVLQVPEELKRLEDEAVQKERAFKQQYREETGRDWIAYYPRNPTKMYMYPVEEVGQIFEATSNHSYYHCYPESQEEEDVAKCRESELLTVELQVHAVSPKVMSIANFLSDFECDHIIELARPRLNRSTIGQGESIEVSYTRTSLSTFLSRTESEILDNIHRRIADVMKIDEGHLWNNIGCEDLQVLHYEVGQQFYDHPDYGTDSPNMRYLTFLMYLNEVEEGGQTAFRSADLEVFPKRGHVTLFYSALEDGNADVKSIHAGRPIIKGEKWGATLWIWDPHR